MKMSSEKTIANNLDSDLIIDKQKSINKIINKLELNKEALLFDHFNDNKLINEIRNISKTKGGFLSMENRKKLWSYLFYLKYSKKGEIDLIIINKDINLNIFQLNWLYEKKQTSIGKLKNNPDYEIIKKDIPRTCKNIISNRKNLKSSINDNKKIPTELLFFNIPKLKYKYLQGLLNIYVYFDLLFQNELNTISSLNKYFEYFNKEFVDPELSKDKKDDKIIYITSIIKDLYELIYPKKLNAHVENSIIILSTKWIISNFVSEMKDINKGYRIFDYLITNEPYIKYVLATVLINEYNKKVKDKLKTDLDKSYEEIFNELKKSDLDLFDIDEIIENVDDIIIQKGNKIKKMLIKKYGNDFMYTFNENNKGLESYYISLFDKLGLKKPAKKFKINIPKKYLKHSILIIIISIGIYLTFKYINEGRYFW